MNIAAYPKYKSYKTTDVKWIPEAPAHWEVKPLLAAARVVSEANRPDLELLSVYLGRGVIRFSDVEEKRTNATSTDLSKYQVVCPGNLVLNNQQAWRGSVGVSEYTGIVSPAYIVLELSDSFDSRFADYYFQTSTTVSHFLVSSKGVGTIQRNLYWPALRRCSITIPPHPEQRAIATFLDGKCAKIDEAVRIKEEQIKLLRERRQILIQQAVTRGLNPDAPMKDSGIDWIGQIPAHWEIENPKWLFENRKQRAIKGDPQLAATQKYGVIPQDMFMELEGRRVVAVFLDFDILKHVEAGDFVMSMRSFQGGLEYSEYTGCVSSAYVALKPGSQIYARFFKYLFKSKGYIEALQATSNLVRDGQALRFDNFAMVPLPVIPLDEQKFIADRLDEILDKSDRAISIKQDQISALKEYKTSLINAAVTGKIKVC
ncbi:restriction endonuclease subunit S [Dyella sp. A6]|uniref:restriction endonuclease subunit S n=1 Tax=Dyella aluminiiresistens TaxID=3069105 RepID=UPI002E768F0D|nr:restriction endonuclease subunit S [Dyella sp. A6]